MHSRRSSITTVVSILAAAGALALAAGAASCAQSGAGENQNFTDASAISDATTDTGSGGGDSSSNADGPSCDADTMTNLFNCGSCGHKCGSGETCSCGMCQAFCTGGKTACCGQCVDTTKDPANCGQCTNQCLPPSSGIGTPVCVASTCAFTCPDAGPEGGTIISCGADAGTPGCYDPTSSANACGGCGKACDGGGSCVNSTCCPSGDDAICGGQCASLQTDPHHCGACDAGCGVGDGGTCMAGKCVGYVASTPTVPFIDACSLPGHQTTLTNQSFWAHSSALNLPFSFSSYGTAFTQVWLQSQGAIGFGAPSTNPFTIPDNFPQCGGVFDPTTGYPAAVAFGDTSLATGPNGVCYGSTSSVDGGAPVDGGGDAGAPNQFVVTWSQATLLGDTGSVLTFSIVLTEGTNTIDFQYETMSSAVADGGLDPTVAGANASVGLQNQGVMLYTPWSCNTSFITATPLDVRFTP